MNNVLTLSKKAFTWAVVAMTIAWSIGLSALIPAGAVLGAMTQPEDVEAGDLVRKDGSSAVYYITDDMERMYFAFDHIFNTFGLSFSDVKVLPANTDLDALAQPASVGAVAPLGGTLLVTSPASPAYYAIGCNNMRHKIADEAAAVKLFGANWAASPARAIDIPDFIMSLWKIGAELDGSEPFCGQMLKDADGVVYRVDAAGDLWEVDGDLPASVAKFALSGATAESWVDSLDVAGTVTPADVTSNVSQMTGDSSEEPGGETPATKGDLMASLSASTPASQDIPTNVSVEFLKLNLKAGSSEDASVNGIKLSAAGLGTATEIDSVTVYANGMRYGNSRDVDSNKVATINFTTPLVIAKGTTQEVVIKALVTGTGKYALKVDAASDIVSSAKVTGSFPITGNSMAGNSVTVGKLTFDDDGSLSAVKLGDKGATLAKMKVTNDNVEDVTLKQVIMRRDSASTANDSVVENLSLVMEGGDVVATASGISGKYVTFTLDKPVTILKNGVKRFTVKGDVIDGAGKTLKLTFDSKADISAQGEFYKYPSIIDISTDWTAQSVSINAGAVTIQKVNAAVTKVKKDTPDAILGTFKVTVNSGASAELSTLKLSILTTNDNSGSAAAFTQIENVEVLLKNTNTVYDLAYASGTATKVYSNTSMGLILNSGTTYEFVVRADVKSTASNGDYTVSIADAAGGDLVLKETGNDTTITDITPNSSSLTKVQVETASVTFSKNALSSALTAVVGTPDVELFSFNVKAGEASDLRITQLKFADRGASTVTKSIVSEFKLWKGSDIVKTVSANDLSSEVITFSDLSQPVAAKQTVSYKLTASLVNDSNQDGEVLNFGLSGYSIEETNKSTAVYDTAIDSNSDGVVASGGFDSARTVTVAGYGSLNVSVDNTITATKYDSNQLAGTTGIPVATFKVKASNESVKVTSLKVVSSVDLSSNVSRYSLWDGSTEVAYSTNIGATTTTLDQDFVVTGEKLYTLKVDLHAIGENQPGGLNKSATFKLATVEAEGDQSGSTLTDGNDNSTLAAGEIGYETDSVNGITSASKTMTIVASKMSNISLVSQTSDASVKLATKISSGVAANAALIQVTVPQTNNTNSDGTAVKLSISNLKVKLEHNLTSYTATVERVGGSGSATSGTTSTSYATFASLSGTDYQVNPGETVYFLVKVTPTFTGSFAGDTSLKVTLDNLNGTSASNDANGANFTWKDLTAGAAKYPVRLPGISSIDGIQITN